MNKFKKILISFVLFFSFQINSYSQNIPGSFADLAEKLMPSVVNISTTTIITTQSNPFPFQFPPGSPFEDMFKEFGAPQERKSSALGSGFGLSFATVLTLIVTPCALMLRSNLTAWKEQRIPKSKKQN